MDELKTIQKLDDIIQDLRMDGLHEIADQLEIEKQKSGLSSIRLRQIHK